MNEHNHHRIIRKFAEGKSGIDIIKLEEASDFADDFRGILKTNFSEDPIGVTKEACKQAANSAASSALHTSIISGGDATIIAFDVGYSLVNSIKANEEISKVSHEWLDENNYYYYHFYYDIEIEPHKDVENHGTIKLIRIDETDCSAKSTFAKYEKTKEYSKDQKLFFTAVNNREDYYLTGVGEGSNQSNCVAFLHAMGAQTKHKGFHEQNSQHTFEEHLKKCFAEYLFIKDDAKALFMLGIAFHGIMDSFTPSHTMFQIYNEQNMALHAQGDVIPINDHKETYLKGFIPGQYNEETKDISKILAKYIKGYDDGDILSDLEYEMLRLFFIISRISRKGKELSIQEIDKLYWDLKSENATLSKIKEVLSNEYTYGEKSYDYSNLAIDSLTKIYEFLYCERKNTIKSYKYYKDNKENICTIALDIWIENYKKLKSSYENSGLLNKDHLNGFKPISTMLERIAQFDLNHKHGGANKI